MLSACCEEAEDPIARTGEEIFLGLPKANEGDTKILESRLEMSFLEGIWAVVGKLKL